VGSEKCIKDIHSLSPRLPTLYVVLYSWEVCLNIFLHILVEYIPECCSFDVHGYKDFWEATIGKESLILCAGNHGPGYGCHCWWRWLLLMHSCIVLVMKGKMIILTVTMATAWKCTCLSLFAVPSLSGEQADWLSTLFDVGGIIGRCVPDNTV